MSSPRHRMVTSDTTDLETLPHYYALQGLLNRVWDQRPLTNDVESSDLAIAHQGIIHHARSKPSLFAARFQVQVGVASKERLPAQILCTCRNTTSPLMEAVLGAFPEAVSIQDSDDDGKLLIHKAIYNVLPLQVVRHLHERFPESSLARTFRGQTPLHIACFVASLPFLRAHSARKEATIEYLVNVCPRAAVERDCNGVLPLHGLLQSHGLVNFPVDAVLHACRTNPCFASMTDGLDGKGELPIRMALQACVPREDARRRLVRALLEAYPAVVDNNKFILKVWLYGIWDVRLTVLAYHLARRSNANKTLLYTERYPLHAILHCRFSDFVLFGNDSLIHFGDRFNHLDESGCLPLHIALRPSFTREVVPVICIAELVRQEPRAALVRDPCTGLYPVLAAAAACKGRLAFLRLEERTEWLNLIYVALRVSVQVLLIQ